jgi:glycosyltransferase involved in cell wall biosynthesis
LVKMKKRCNCNKNESKSLHLCVVSCFPPSKGPLSEYTYYLVKNFSKNSKISKVTVLADKIGEGGGGEVLTEDRKIKVVRCWNLNDILTPFNIMRKIHEIKPDIIYFNLVFRHFSSNRLINFLGLCTPAIAKLLNIPVVVSLHSIVEILDINAVGYSNSIINKIGIRLATKLILKADVVSLTHHHLVNIVREKYGGKNVLYIPHGTFNEPIADYNFGSKRLLLFGKMGSYKNPGLALEAFKDIVDKDRKAELVIAGSSHPLNPGFLESILERYKEIPNVKVTGYIPENELQNIFITSTAVVLPYTISTWSSGVFTLASMYGRPVIAADLPDFRELVKEGAGIILFPVGDREALAKNMELILGNKELQKKLGEANLQWARQHNSFKQVTIRLVEVFEELLARKKKN